MQVTSSVVLSDTTRRTMVCDLNIADGPTLRKQHTDAKMYRLEAITVEWRSDDGEPWKIARVHLAGQRMSKSGTPTGTEVEEQISMWRWDRDVVPDDVRDLIEGTKPKETP